LQSPSAAPRISTCPPPIPKIGRSSRNSTGYNDPGHAHSLTFCCFRRQPFLTKDRPCQWLADAIALAREKHEFDLWAYVFMPEHVHLLVCARHTPYDVSKFLATIKQSVTHKAIAHIRQHAPAFLDRMLDAQPNGRRHYRFWQRGPGYDRNTWTDNALLAEIDYIHANPLRRKLCERPEDWNWSSAADYVHARRGPMKVDLESLPRFFVTESPRQGHRPR
jgi:putative transposase